VAKKPQNRLDIVEKIIVKTAVKTVMIILIALIILFAVFNFAFPQHMATACERLGNYSLAVKYASLRYTYTRDADDLSRCVNDSILSGKDEYIADFGEQMLELDTFDELVAQNGNGYPGGVDYNQYLSGKVAASKYATGDFDGAFEIAFKANGDSSFASGNPLMVMSIRIISEKDKTGASQMAEGLQKVSPEDEGEQTNLRELIKRLRTVALS
jgi:hypothetical protein